MLQVKKISFSYGGFWDVPRTIVCGIRDLTVVLDSPFDDEADDYETDYTVYIVLKPLPAGVAVNWSTLAAEDSVSIGRLPVSEINFDPTKRKWFDAEPLLRLIALSGRSV